MNTSARTRPCRLRVEELETRTVPALVTGDPINYEPDSIIVRVKGAVAPAPNAKSLGIAGLYSVPVPADKSVRDVIAQFSKKSGVLYAEPNYEIHAYLSPNDPSYANGSLWGMHNTGQSGGTPDVDIDAPEGWDVRTGAPDVVVGVIDTGVDYNHPDLVDNMWTNPGEIPGDGKDNDKNGFIDDVHGYDFVNNDGDPMDDQFHGTHCAGTIAGEGNNGEGVVGVAWSAKIMALKFLNENGNGTLANAVRAINYAVKMKADLTSNSWGGGGFMKSLQDAIAAANAAGQPFIAAAGNDGKNNDLVPSYPANYDVPNVVSVAALDRTGALAGFSNYGHTVDIGAPGVDILSAFPVAHEDGPYASISGTSMATPHVAGAMALLIAQFPNETPAQLRARLLAETVPVSGTAGNVQSNGFLNLSNLLTPTPRVVKLSTFSNATGLVTKLRLNFSEPMDLTTITAANVRVTGPMGTVLGGKPVAADTSKTVFDIAFPPQNLLNGGGMRVRVSQFVKSAGGVSLNQNDNGTPGETSDAFLGAVVSVTGQGGSTAFGTTDFTMSVPTGLGTVSDVDARIDLTHPQTGDLTLSVVSPSNRVGLLANRLGLDGDDFTATVFDDEAPKTIFTGAAPFKNLYQPERVLNAARGAASDGAWRLRVTDNFTGADGVVNSFGLTLATSGAAASNLSITAVTPVDENASTIAPAISGLEVTFNAPVHLPSLALADVKIVGPTNLAVPVKSLAVIPGSGNTRFRLVTPALERAGVYTVKIGPNVASTLGLVPDGDNDGAPAEPNDHLTHTVTLDNSVFRSSKRVAIPSGKTVFDTISVPRNITIDRVALELNIQHTFVSDLVITLTSPGNESIVVFDRKGGNGDNFVRTILSDAAVNALTAGTAPFHGEFKPDNPMTGLSGDNAKGAWKLSINDGFFPDPGVLLSWALHIKPATGSGT